MNRGRGKVDGLILKHCGTTPDAHRKEIVGLDGRAIAALLHSSLARRGLEAVALSRRLPLTSTFCRPWQSYVKFACQRITSRWSLPWPIVEGNDESCEREHLVVQFMGVPLTRRTPAPFLKSAVLTEEWRLVNRMGNTSLDIEKDRPARRSFCDSLEVVERTARALPAVLECRFPAG